MHPLAGRRHLALGALALAIVGLLAFTGWQFAGPEPAPAPPAAAAPTGQATAVLPTQAAAAPQRTAAPPAPAGPAGMERTADGTAGRHRLQQRLDALGAAYNAGDASAVARALWANHATVRPDGTTMYRSDLLAQWNADWQVLKHRDLSFFVEEFTESGTQVTALWSLTLTATVGDAHGRSHAYQFHGFQKARYSRAGEQELLDGPIEYTGFDQLLDGEPWHGDFHEL